MLTRVILLVLVLGLAANGSAATRHARKKTAARTADSKSAPELTLDELEADVLLRINAVREKEGIAPLRRDERLMKLARDYSRLMAERNFFEHVTPEGVTLQQRIEAAGISYTRLGENIYKSYNRPDPGPASVNAWLNSPGHRANILNAAFTETGLGAWRAGKSVYLTQEFLRPN